MNMRILIEGAGMVNKGAEAMLKTVIAEFRRRIHASFFVESANVYPGTEHLFDAAGVQILKYSPTKLIEKLSIYASYARENPTQLRQLWKDRISILSWEKILSNIDLIVDISGFRYSQKVGCGGAFRTAPIINIAKRDNKPYIFFPQAFGPFDGNALLEKICYESFSNARLLYARDMESRDYLAKLLNKNINDIRLAPDIAFCFNSENSSFASNYLESYGIYVNKQPIICIAPNVRVYERASGFGIKNTYLQLLSKICSHYIDKGISIVFVPHEIKLSPRETDDRWLCELLHLSLGKSKSSVAITEELSAEKIKSIIAYSDLLIGSRFHAIVAALHSRVPVVALGWAHKYIQLMQDVELDKFVVNYQELGEEEVSQVVNLAWEQRKANKKKLEEKIPRLEELSTSIFDQVLKVI
jgi:polysaccharide pyruvyl transferase WcaK-like protein